MSNEAYASLVLFLWFEVKVNSHHVSHRYDLTPLLLRQEHVKHGDWEPNNYMTCSLPDMKED